MNESANFADVARRAADRLSSSLDPKLHAAVEQELTRDPFDTRPERFIEPVSLAAFIVSLASFGWTVYHDLKKDHDAAKAKADRPETEASLAVLLREDESFTAGRLPAGMTTEQQTLILNAVAAEIVAADPL
jgi:hypothetical protein